MDAADEREGREKTLERQIRAFHWVRMLSELPSRLSGTPGERDAAERIEAWLRELGVEDVSLTAVASRPRVGVVLGLHLAVGALACAIGGGAGLVVAALATLSFHRELRRGRPGLASLLGSPDSVNVAARAGALRPRRRVVLTAHVDTSPAGGPFSPRLTRLFARVPGGRSLSPGPYAVVERALLSGLVLVAVSALGASGWSIAVARGLIGGVLGIGAIVSLGWARSGPSPGANDNASGVAAMLTCAEQLLTRLPDDVELWLVGTGAGEVGGCGMRAFLETHADWRTDRTYLIDFECVGGGSLHYVRSESTLDRVVHPPMMRELARRLAGSGAFGEVEPVDLLARTDGLVAAERDLHVLTLVSLDRGGVPRRYHRRDDLPENLEMETIIRSADFAAAVVWAALRGEADPLAIV